MELSALVSEFATSQYLLLDFEDYICGTSSLPDEVEHSLGILGDRQTRARAYVNNLEYTILHDTFLVTWNGSLEICTGFPKPGDIIVVFDDANMASILREVRSNFSTRDMGTKEPGEKQWYLIGVATFKDLWTTRRWILSIAIEDIVLP